MKRSILAALALLMPVLVARAEVLIDRSNGGTEVVFTPSATGPWGVVSEGAFPDDLLNADGDKQRDGSPSIVLNAATGREDLVWIDGPTDRVRFASFDGWGWTPMIDVSMATGHAPDLVSDTEGNRFITWSRRGSKDPVYFNALAYDNQEAVGVYRLNHANDRVSDPGIVFHDGDIFVTYNGQESGGDGINYVVVDRVRVFRDGQGRVTTNGGADVPIIDNSARRNTNMPAAGSCLPMAHTENGHLWVDWVDSEDRMGWMEKFPGADEFGPARYRTMEGGVAQTRKGIRTEVLFN